MFVHVPSEIAAHEVEEIEVEHLLRDVKDTTISTLVTEVTSKLAALKGLDARLRRVFLGFSVILLVGIIHHSI
ncbi:hypothetical protein COCNU_scaffold000755G000030 [Cocos nucifera]|nr:hypothetical protein [Cocos nucifera]